MLHARSARLEADCPRGHVLVTLQFSEVAMRRLLVFSNVPLDGYFTDPE